MKTDTPDSIVEGIAYPVFLFSILAFVPLALATLWSGSEDETLWKSMVTFGIIAVAAVLAISATSALRRQA